MTVHDDVGRKARLIAGAVIAGDGGRGGRSAGAVAGGVSAAQRTPVAPAARATPSSTTRTST